MTPTFLEVLEQFTSNKLKGVNVALPGRVVSYDASKLRADVQPLIKRAYENEEGERATESFPIVPSVPVVFPGAGAYRITFPVAAGDTVLLVFASSSLDVWLSEGGEVDPLDDRRHATSDAIAIPGLRDFKNAPAAGTDALAVEASEVRLGSHDASDPVALSSELAALKSAIASWTPVAQDGGASLKAVFSSWSVPGATKVKAE